MPLSNDRNSFRPYPNWVDPRGHGAPRYRIVDTNHVSLDQRQLGSSVVVGATDKQNGVLMVPLDEPGRHVVNHEMGHVMWSPVSVPRTSVRFTEGELRCYVAVEEARVNMGLATLGMMFEQLQAGKHTKPHIEALDKPRENTVVILDAIAAFGTDIESLACSGVTFIDEEHDREFAKYIIQAVNDKLVRATQMTEDVVPSTRSARTIAKWLYKKLGEADERSKSRTAGKGFGLAGGANGTFPAGGIPSEDIEHMPQGTFRPSDNRVSMHGWSDKITYRDMSKYVMNGFVKPFQGPVQPGTMTIEEPPLPMSCTEIRTQKKRSHVSAEEGVMLGDIYRIITDRRVFKRKLRKKRGGGTVLFDVSGSMGELATIIDEVISNNPSATTCAIYAGNDEDGVLRVIVRSGKRVPPNEMRLPYMGNVVDLPAIDWLTRQPAPRVWVSDQQCTGVGDRGSTTLRTACVRMCNAFNVTILGSPRQVSKHLQEWHKGEKNEIPKHDWDELGDDDING